MTSTLVKKPGYMFRAVVAWFIYNFILLATLAAILFVLRIAAVEINQWFILIPLVLGIIVSEWIIFAETIAPIISDWIKQEEWKEDKS